MRDHTKLNARARRIFWSLSTRFSRRVQTQSVSLAIIRHGTSLPPRRVQIPRYIVIRDSRGQYTRHCTYVYAYIWSAAVAIGYGGVARRQLCLTVTGGPRPRPDTTMDRRVDDVHRHPRLVANNVCLTTHTYATRIRGTYGRRM